MKHRHSDRLVATICGLTNLAPGGLLTTGSASAQSSALPTGSGRVVNGGIGVEPEVERPIGSAATQASNQEAAA